jgi:hypothetical protein
MGLGRDAALMVWNERGVQNHNAPLTSTHEIPVYGRIRDEKPLVQLPTSPDPSKYVRIGQHDDSTTLTSVITSYRQSLKDVTEDLRRAFAEDGALEVVLKIPAPEIEYVQPGLECRGAGLLQAPSPDKAAGDAPAKIVANRLRVSAPPLAQWHYEVVPSQPDVFGRATPLKIDWRLVRTIESTREPGVRSDVDNGFKLTLFELKFDEDYVLFVRAYEPENYPLGVTCEWACKHIRLEHRTEGHERIQQLSPTMMSRQTSRATGSKERLG